MKKVLGLIFIFITSALAGGQIALNADGYFEGPGFAFLIYHNNYIGGRQGGLQMILHGERVLDAGAVFCRTADGKKIGYYDNGDKEIGERMLDLDNNTVTVREKIVPLDISYDLIIRSNGEAMRITVRLDEPIDWGKVRDFIFKIELYPEAYQNKTYIGGGRSDSFRERDMGRRELIRRAPEILIAPEDRLRSLKIRADKAVLGLYDERRDLKISGYMIFAALPRNSSEREFSVHIVPDIDPDWRRPPVIQIDQVGYHPAQVKRAVLELDARTSEVGEMQLLHLQEDGTLKMIKSGVPIEWGPLFNYRYYTFDFTDVRQPGQYFLRYGEQQVGPFRIGEDVLAEAWQPTLDIFFPVQMCHVKVRNFLHVWHGACHLDDALQAPTDKKHIDGYRQGPSTETSYQPNEHIPDLNWGGWHDAGDFDLASGSQCKTLLWLALAQEEFAPGRDVTTVSRAKRLVDLFEPDGKDDLLQQISFGAEFLLGLYRQIGHIPPGIIANTGPLYGAHGDPASITDGLIYDPALKPEETRCERSGLFDDRWIFTNRNTGGQYQFAQVAAICSRVLRGYDDALADECLQAAQKVWAYEQSHEPVHFKVAYQPQEDEYHSLELAAAAELFLTSGKAEYQEKLKSYAASIQAMPALRFGQGVGFTLIRVLHKVKDESFRRAVIEKTKEFHNEIAAVFAKSPYGVNMRFGIWGNNWSVLSLGARLYYFIKIFPDIFKAEYLYSAVHYNFGCHPATNHSYVSGVGAKSATIGFGFNRADKTYIPGGVVSGASLIRPRFPEYRSRAWDWYQTEYVIGGSAAFVFDVLAAEHVLTGK